MPGRWRSCRRRAPVSRPPLPWLLRDSPRALGARAPRPAACASRPAGARALRGCLAGGGLPLRRSGPARARTLGRALELTDALSQRVQLVLGGDARLLHLRTDLVADHHREPVLVPLGPLHQVGGGLRDLLLGGVAIEHALRDLLRAGRGQIAERPLDRL